MQATMERPVVAPAQQPLDEAGVAVQRRYRAPLATFLVLAASGRATSRQLEGETDPAPCH